MRNLELRLREVEARPAPAPPARSAESVDLEAWAAGLDAQLAALAVESARRKSLSLEEQLRLLRQDYESELLERSRRRAAGIASDAPPEAYVDRLHDILADKLQRKVLERDGRANM